eukprot:scaffold4869_cov123-Isochrysis_galbana.AAC.1
MGKGSESRRVVSHGVSRRVAASEQPCRHMCQPYTNMLSAARNYQTPAARRTQRRYTRQRSSTLALKCVSVSVASAPTAPRAPVANDLNIISARRARHCAPHCAPCPKAAQPNQRCSEYGKK